MRFLIFFILLCTRTLAQTTGEVGVSITLPAVALIDIEPNSSPLALNLAPPTKAGDVALTTTSDNSKWLNFTSAVVPSSSRSITAQVSGTLPSGLNLKLITANYAGIGAGALGNSIGTIYLNASQQAIVKNIGGAYTGNGQGNGYNLTYLVEITDYSLLKAQTATVSIIYTLIDN